MTLKDLLKVMTPSERTVIIYDGKEIFKGYVGCMQYYDLPLEKEVEGARLGTEICGKEKHDEMEANWLWKTTGIEKANTISPEQVDQYKFSDLILTIFIRITLAVADKQEGNSA